MPTSPNDALNQLVHTLGTAPWLWRYACMYAVWFVFMMIIFGVHGWWNIALAIFYPVFIGLSVLELVCLIVARFARSWSWVLLIGCASSAGMVMLSICFILVSALDGWGGVYIAILVIMGVFFNILGAIMLFAAWKNDALDDSAE